MTEDIRFRPAREIEPCSGGQEGECGLGQFGSPFPDQSRVERLLDGVKIEYVGGGVFELRLGQGLRPPVARLLLFGYVDPEQFVAKVLQPVPVGIGAHQFRGDLGAIDRCGECAEGMEQNGYVEAAEVKELEREFVGEQGSKARCRRLSARDLDEMGVTVASRELHEAKPVSVRIETHCFAVDGHDRPEVEPLRKIAFMQRDRHRPAL